MDLKFNPFQLGMDRSMVGSIDRIEREIAVLEEAIANLASEFRSAYDSYLTALGQAMRQQLVLAGYHLCTQGYPEAFLRLSFSERQKIQQGLRQAAKAAQEQLRSLVKVPEEAEPLTPETPDPAPIPETTDAEVLSDSSAMIPNLSVRHPKSLEEIVAWQETIEQAIAAIFRTLSRDANRLLQQSDILPRKLPEPVLEVAAKADATGEAVAGPPNLLNLIIETEDAEDTQNLGGTPISTTMHIVAIHLRLAEIEFTDGNVTAWRQQIRSLSARLSTLRRDYQKKLRERAVIEAESAWRSCWYED